MSRRSNNQRCLFLLSALTAALLWLAPARSVQAAVYTYPARQRTINAGVLFVGSAADPVANAVAPNVNVPDPAPYLFYVLDQRADVKPVGWTFINPIAPTTVSTATATRWGYTTVGAGVTRDMAAYWEVSLRDISADELQQFDVLYLPAGAGVFYPSDNEKLRRFVDNGGQLIVEYSSAGDASHVLFTGTNLAGGTGATLVPPAASAGFDLHPLLTQPYFFNFLPAASSDFLLLGTPVPNGPYGTIAGVTSDFNNLFSPVLSQSSGTAVAAAQLGGGQIVTSTLNIGPAVSISQGKFFGSANPATVPSVNLKFLANMIAWADAHPTENKTSHQNAAGPSSASYTAAWAFPDPAQGTPLNGFTPPPAAVWGNYIYVTDSTGTLSAFDAIPNEPLTGGSYDDGVPDFGSSSTPTPYDRLWSQSVGTSANPVSAPTVATFGGTSDQTLVMVEDKTGVVHVFNAVTGVAFSPATLGTANSTSFPGSVPAPTFYDGKVYAGQPDGTLLVYTLSGGGSAAGGVIIPVNPANANGNGNGNNTEYVTAAPAVGLLASGTTTNSIVAYVPTSQNMNTVLLGARNDPLVGYSTNGQFQGYNINRNARYGLFNIFVDTSSIPYGRSYDAFGNNVITANAGNGQDPVFPSTVQLADSGSYYGDWDVDFAKSIPQGSGMTLTLHEIKATSLANNSGTGAALSAPAIDRSGNYYYTVNDGTNSYLFGVLDDIQQRNARIKFRFRIPPTINDPEAQDPINGSTYWNNVDADNVNYNNTNTNADGSSRSLIGMKFVGAPVVDNQGNVYVAAQNGGVGAVLCFNANQEVTAEAETVNSSPPLLTPNTAFDATQATYFQNDEFNAGTNPSRNPLVALPTPARGAARYGQITTAGDKAAVFNFGRGSGGSRQIAGNLTEPQPFTAVPNQQANASATPTWMYFHTNLAWYMTFAVNGPISGLSKTGNTLFLCDSSGSSGNSNAYNTLYKLSATQTVGVGKVATGAIQKTPLGTGALAKPLDIGTVSAAPSAGGGAMVINGSKGIAAFNQQLTLIADNNRILEVDADGNAVWSADGTTRAVGNGATTKVDFAHPSALSQFAPNDYLVADTGNNRCVRFDRAGNVLWELTRFYDPGGLTAPGQPLTLSQPSSVEVRRTADTVNTNNTNGTMTSYLIADSGNDRIVEVTDTFDQSGNIYVDANQNPHYHLLSWVTHTGDLLGRRYRYAGASYLDIPSASANTADTLEVFALVTNTRIAPLVGGQPAPASADAAGGSIVAFNRPSAPLSYSAIANTTPKPNDLQFVATRFTSTTASGTQTYPVRNPRFLHVFAPPQGTPTNATAYAYSFLYADDNGAFDLVYTGQTTPPTSYGLAFTQANYQAMTVPINGVTLSSTVFTTNRSALPFVPTCIQRLNDDDTNIPNFAHVERYLITQSFSQGELGTPPTVTGSALPFKMGGEVFELDVSTDSSNNVSVDPAGGFGGGLVPASGSGNPAALVGFTLSRPVGTTPLTQPTFAIRTTQ